MAEHRERYGVSAAFESRSDAERAVEHLVQEHGVDRSTIFVAPAGDRNSVGPERGGSDVASASPATSARDDAPRREPVRLTVPVSGDNRSTIEATLRSAGARAVDPPS